MTESQFQRFRPGLDTLQQLRSQDPVTAYNTFLLLRGTKAMSRFSSKEHQALSRLLCLGGCFDNDDGRGLCDAFDRLSPEECLRLTLWLNADGVKHCPGYV